MQSSRAWQRVGCSQCDEEEPRGESTARVPQQNARKLYCLALLAVCLAVVLVHRLVLARDASGPPPPEDRLWAAVTSFDPSHREAAAPIQAFQTDTSQTLTSTTALDRPPSSTLQEDSQEVGVDGVQNGTCQDWDVRLLGTEKVPSGTPEVFMDGAWRPICGHYFWNDGKQGDSAKGATIFCKQLGYTSGKLSPTANYLGDRPGRGAYRSGSVFIHSCARDDYPNLSSCAVDPKQREPSGSMAYPGCQAGQKVAVEITCYGDSGGAHLESRAGCAVPITSTSTVTTSTTSYNPAAGLPVLRDILGYVKGPKFEELQQRLHKRCALVGSSSILRGKGHGAAIDGHDVVIRVNRIPNPEYYHDFGKTSQVVFLNTNLLHTGKVTLFRDSAKVACKYLPNCKHAALVFRDDWHPCDLNRLKREWGSTHPFIGCPHYNFTRMPEHLPQMPKRRQPSTGFIAFLTFAPLCQEITLYGFWGRTTADHHFEWSGHPLANEHTVEHEIADGKWGKVHLDMPKPFRDWVARNTKKITIITN